MCIRVRVLFSSGSVLSGTGLAEVPEDLDEPLPLKQRVGLAKWAESRAMPLVSFRQHMGLQGKAQTTKFQILKRKMKRLLARRDKATSVLQHQLKATSSAWNRDRLRRHDRLDPHHGARRKSSTGVRIGRSYQGTHPCAWTAAGCVRLAFRQIGTLTQDAVRTTRRELDAISAVGMAAHTHMQDASKTLMFGLGAGRSPWLFVGRSHDCTPIKVRRFDVRCPSNLGPLSLC